MAFKKSSKKVAKKPAKEPVKKAVKKAAKKPIKRKRKSKKKPSTHYVDSKRFFDLIKSYYETDIIDDELAQSICKIANGLSYAPNFINYSYKDEMVGDAILKMFSAVKNKKFNVDSGNNPFSYFTTIAFHAFINRIKKEKKYKETVTRYQEAMYSDELNQPGAESIYVQDQQTPHDDN